MKKSELREILVNREIFVEAYEVGQAVVNFEFGEDVDLEDFYSGLCSHDDDDEVMQYWIVSSYMHEALRLEGEPVFYWKGLYFWGRTQCGGALFEDDVFERIFDLESRTDLEEA